MTAVQAASPRAIEGPPAASLDVGGRALDDRIRDGAPGWLLAFAFVLVLGAKSGGYWPTAWDWGALALLVICAVTLVARADVRLGAYEAAMPIALLALVGWGLVSALWNTSATQPLLQSQRTVLYAAAVLAVLLLVRGDSYRLLLGGVWLAIALVCGYSLLTRLFPERLGSIDDLAGNRLSQPLGYWNALGIFAAIGALLALGFAARGRHPVVRAFAAASTVIVVPTLYFTFSRGAWIALAAGVLTAVVLERRRLQFLNTLLVVGLWPALAVWRASRSDPLTHQQVTLTAASHAGHRFALVAVGLAAAAFTAMLLFAAAERLLRVPRAVVVAYAGALILVVAGAATVGVARFGSPPTIAHRLYRSFVGAPHTIQNGNLNQRLFNLSANQRIPQWKVAWREYRAHPWLGSGLGSYERYWNQNRTTDFKVRNVHNLYLETLAELGPLGLGLLVVAVSLPLAVAVKARRRSLAAAVAGAYVAFLAHAAVDWDWQMPAVTLAGLFCGAALLVSGREALAVALPRLPVWRLSALALTLVLAVFAFVALRGNRAVAGSEAAATKLDWTRSAADARTAQRWAPWSSRPWQLLGVAQLRQGKLAPARTSFRKALEKDHSDWSIWLNLAWASRGAERRHAIAEAARLNPLDSEIPAHKSAPGGK